MEDGLVVIEEKSIATIFQKDGSNSIVDELEKEAANFKGDVTTKKGRDEIKAFSRKFSSFKVKFDGFGKALSDKLRAEIAPINGERNKVEACCDKLRDSTRKPLTDYENIEKKRVADIEERIHTIEDFIDVQLALITTAESAKNALDRINKIDIDETFEEYELAATKAKEKSLMLMESKFIVLQNAENEKAENERLEKERLEKEQKEREDRIAKEAAEKATKDAETKAKSEGEEKERLAKKIIEEKEQINKEAIATAEREKLEAQLATEKAEREKREAADKAEQDKKDAVEAATKRIADAKQAEDIKETARQENKKHRNKIHKEAKASMLENGISEEDATIFVTMVKDGLVKHIKIDY